MSDKTTLVVLGAGASVDPFALLVDQAKKNADAESQQLYASTNELRRLVPPLTKNLALSLQAVGKDCSNLLALIHQSQAQSEKSGEPFDFEAALRAIFEQAGQHLDKEFLALRNALAKRMATADLIGHRIDTLYTDLFARLQGSRRGYREVAVVSLNYDRLAE